uniref:Uncharacterized protein n=1 Tax=Moumouvirus sp. 'Monve' TaxID=1128131 RepID=H2EF05_9VIRU|nr:hypothetical protein mv_L868 [Moumouvirus Monve]
MVKNFKIISKLYFKI